MIIVDETISIKENVDAKEFFEEVKALPLPEEFITSIHVEHGVDIRQYM